MVNTIPNLGRSIGDPTIVFIFSLFIVSVLSIHADSAIMDIITSLIENNRFSFILSSLALIVEVSQYRLGILIQSSSECSFHCLPAQEQS